MYVTLVEPDPLTCQSLDKLAVALSFLSVPSGFVTDADEDVMWNPEYTPFGSLQMLKNKRGGGDIGGEAQLTAGPLISGPGPADC
jgi:hypothetical protein